MFFEKEMLSLNILEVLKLKQKDVKIYNVERNFNSLSFRIKADTYLKTDKKEYHFKDNYVSYLPSRLNYNRVSKEDELIVVHFETTNYFTDEIEYFVPKNPQIFADLFNKILDCFKKQEIGYKYKCTALLYEIFAECYKQNYKGEVKGSKIEKSIDYIYKNYKNKELTINEIAAQSFISEVYFRKLFKAKFKTSPQKYIIKLRLQNAVGLISTGYYSLKEIADMSGYSDYKHFSVEFKKNIGVSPSEYFYNYNKKSKA